MKLWFEGWNVNVQMFNVRAFAASQIRRLPRIALRNHCACGDAAAGRQCRATVFEKQR
jgi:hypothetical protein